MISEITKIIKTDIGYQQDVLEQLYEELFSQSDKINRLLDDIVSRRSPKVVLRLPKSYQCLADNKNDGISVMYDGVKLEGIIEYGKCKNPEAYIGDRGTIHICGRGRTGLEDTSLGMRLVHMDFNVSEPGSVYAKPVKKGDLGLFFSGSWETKSTVMYARETKKRGATTVAITSHPKLIKKGYCDYWIKFGGKESLGEIRDRYVGKLKGKSTTHMDNLGTVFEWKMSAFKDILIHLLCEELGIEEGRMKERHVTFE
jgi:D-arabinose 5-phosphate isomerase GutQ